MIGWKAVFGNIVMKGSIGNFRPWHMLLKNPTTCTRRVGITKGNILAYYHKLLTKLLNFCVLKKSKNKNQYRKQQICGNAQLSCLKISRLIIYNTAWGEPTNNSRAFIFALLTKLTARPQFLLLGHLRDRENNFFFQALLCNKEEDYSLFKMSLCPVTFWYIFFNSDGKICSRIFKFLPKHPCLDHDLFLHVVLYYSRQYVSVDYLVFDYFYC